MKQLRDWIKRCKEADKKGEIDSDLAQAYKEAEECLALWNAKHRKPTKYKIVKTKKSDKLIMRTCECGNYHCSGDCG